MTADHQSDAASDDRAAESAHEQRADRLSASLAMSTASEPAATACEIPTFSKRSPLAEEIVEDASEAAGRSCGSSEDTPIEVASLAESSGGIFASLGGEAAADGPGAE
jgi:hypothetical protein